MIIFEGVRCRRRRRKKRNLLTAVQASLPSDRRIAIFSRNEQDKKIFIDLLAGVVLPSRADRSKGAGVFRPVTSADSRVGCPFVRSRVLPGSTGGCRRRCGLRQPDFGAGKDFNKLRDLPNLKKRYLSDILAFSIPFDVYLLGEDVVRPGSARYNKEARALFEARCKTSGMFIASEDAAFAREFCDMGLVLSDGNLRLFRNVERAIAFSEKAAEAPGGSREERRGARKRKRKKTRVARHHSQE